MRYQADAQEGAAPAGLTEDHWRLLRTQGRLSAAGLGLTIDDAEDCADEFVGKMVDRGRRAGWNGNPAWLQRCADNHARDYRRRLLCRQGDRLPDGEDETRQVDSARQCVEEPLHVGLLRAELYQKVGAAVSRLHPLHRDLVVRHYGEGKSARIIAQETGRTEHAVTQALSAARRRLGGLLGEMGLDEPVVNEYRDEFNRGARECYHGPRRLSGR